VTRRIRSSLPALGLTTLAALGALTLIPAALGYRRYVVEGGSMGTAIPRGSLVLDEPVRPADLKVGDVITYATPHGARVTHRIVAIGRGRTFRTKGDANPTRDPWAVTVTGHTQARVALDIPLVGYAYAALAVRAVRIVVLGVPALLIALAAVRRGGER
jgi:signal peptidase I